MKAKNMFWDENRLIYSSAQMFDWKLTVDYI